MHSYCPLPGNINIDKVKVKDFIANILNKSKGYSFPPTLYDTETNVTNLQKFKLQK